MLNASWPLSGTKTARRSIPRCSLRLICEVTFVKSSMRRRVASNAKQQLHRLDARSRRSEATAPRHAHRRLGAARTGRGATCRRGGSRGRGRGCVECAVLLDPCRSLGEQGLHRRLARRRRGGAGARLDVERDVAQVRTFAQCGPIPATATNTVSSRPRRSPITQEPAIDSIALSYRARAPRVDSAA